MQGDGSLTGTQRWGCTEGARVQDVHACMGAGYPYMQGVGEALEQDEAVAMPTG